MSKEMQRKLIELKEMLIEDGYKEFNIVMKTLIEIIDELQTKNNKGYMKEVIEGMISKVLNEIKMVEDIKANRDVDGKIYDLMLMMSKRQLTDLYTMLDLV
tara:strand:+ start:780 stop:1082 length:303 start_codon:yes stop_codon:yes gene_type:complete